MNKEQAAAEIMHMFRYHYKKEWAPGSIFDGKPRIWVQTFNGLVKQGLVNRKKTYMGYKYKWAGAWPENY
jgi:hypothetical protein